MRRFGAVWLLGAASLIATGCFLVRGAINDSPELRWWLFAHFGAPRVCQEMMNKSVALTLGDDPASIGRFFPTRCGAAVNDVQQSLTVDFEGTGYAWTPLAGRVAFSASAAVSYRPDFQLGEDVMYVWGRMAQIVTEPRFTVVSVENRVVNWAAQGPAMYLATQFGRQLLQSRVSQGFTVVRTEQGDEFALGILQPPARPARPFVAAGESRVLVNERVRVHANQAEFVGPLIVEGSGQVLSLRTRATGPTVEVHLMPRLTADQWRAASDHAAAITPPPSAPLASWVVAAGDSQQALAVAPGHYVLVIENSSSVGAVAPAWSPLPGVGPAAFDAALIVELRSGE